MHEVASCVYVNDDDQHLLFLRAGQSDLTHCPVHVIMVNRRVSPSNPDPYWSGGMGVPMSDVGFNALLGKKRKVSSFQGCPSRGLTLAFQCFDASLNVYNIYFHVQSAFVSIHYCISKGQNEVFYRDVSYMWRIPF